MLRAAALVLWLSLAACARVGERPFVEMFPNGADDRSPVIYALHGRSDTPEHFSSLFKSFPARAEIAVPRAFETKGFGFQWFEWDLGTSEQQFAANAGAAEEKLWPLLQEHAHGRKIIIVGFSQGAVMAYLLAARHPDDIAAAFPIAGRVAMSQWSNGARTAPLFPMHGTLDERVSIVHGRETAQGFHVELREFEGVKHQIPDAMRDELFAHVAEVLK
jgi:phospholipase/carboxylesterase